MAEVAYDVPITVLNEFKKRLHISHSSEDDNLERLIESSYMYLKWRCGEFDLEKNAMGKELVFERARYAYEGTLEYFDENFKHMIVAFNFDLSNGGGFNETTF